MNPTIIRNFIVPPPPQCINQTPIDEGVYDATLELDIKCDGPGGNVYPEFGLNNATLEVAGQQWDSTGYNENSPADSFAGLGLSISLPENGWWKCVLRGRLTTLGPNANLSVSLQKGFGGSTVTADVDLVLTPT